MKEKEEKEKEEIGKLKFIPKVDKFSILLADKLNREN